MVRLISVPVVVWLGVSSMGCSSVKMDTPMSTAKLASESSTAVQVAKFFEANKLILFAGPKPCGSSNCDVTIEMSATRIDGKDYCVAKLPEQLSFTGTSPSNTAKIITWKMDTGFVTGPMGATMTVEFHQDFGILKVDDGKKQLKPDNQRVGPLQYQAKNEHKELATMTYVPVIIGRSTSTGEPQLCGTADPKIVNN